MSKDLDPIYANPYFPNFGSIPGTITHSMWTSTASGKDPGLLLRKDAPGELSRKLKAFFDLSSRSSVSRYEVSFIDIVLPGEELHVKIKHTGMRQGNVAVKVETYNDREVKVLEGTAEVAQPPTAYVFTGQGSQGPGMGIELYNNSPAAPAALAV
jgi:fatty acid synthase subunit alpha